MTGFMKKLELLWGVPIFYREKGREGLKSSGIYPVDENPLVCSEELTDSLIGKSEGQQYPVVFKDENSVYFLCARGENGFFLSGPVCTEKLDYVQFHRFYKNYGIDAKERRHPARKSLFHILNFASMLSETTGGGDADAWEILRANELECEEETEKETEKEDVILEMHVLDDEIYHHTYQEERYILECVREGNTEGVRQRIPGILESAGILSENQMNHFRYLAVSVVTLAAREAIKAGISPAKVYRHSDILINRIDKCMTEEKVIEYYSRAAEDFAVMVAEEKGRKRTSGYTEQCKDYIFRNYHHRISVEEIAAFIGVSQGHLSRKFREDTGMSIQDYIQRFRVERAANLLKYSAASLREIADYACFNSQSHFGSVFKKYKGMTPKQYREKYKPKEFL